MAIHAALRRPGPYKGDLLDARVSAALGEADWAARIPYGAVVCTALLTGAYQVAADPYGLIVLDGYPGGAPEVCEVAFGDYAVGRWCWELRDIAPLHPPVPARGSQGWWRWTPPAEEAA